MPRHLWGVRRGEVNRAHFAQAHLHSGVDHVTDDALVTARFLEGLAERLTVHHQVAEDRPTAGVDKFTHVQAKIRVVHVLRRPVLDAQVGLDRDIRIR